MAQGPVPTINLFCSYAHADKQFRDALGKILDALQHEGYINYWYDGMIVPGQTWMQEIEDHLVQAQIILLLVSPDFMASAYCQREMKIALVRQQTREACVIPIIVRAVDWQGSPLSTLQVLRADTRSLKCQADCDRFFAEVSASIRTAINNFTNKQYGKEGVETRDTDKDGEMQSFEPLARRAEIYHINAHIIQGSVLGANRGTLLNNFDSSALAKFSRDALKGNDVLDK